MPQSLDSVTVHFIFSTRNREPFLHPDWAAECHSAIGQDLERGGARLLAAGGVADHVHVLVSIGRVNTIAELVKIAKRAGHSWVTTRKLVPDFAWQRGYAAFAVGVDGLPAVRHYIAAQAEHHATVTFQDECRTLLKRHEIEWDERYVWY